MKEFTVVAAGCFILSIAGLTAAGEDSSYGISMGMPRADVLRAIGSYREITPGMLRTERVPEGHDELESYAIIVSNSHGVCKIMAVGKDVPLNASVGGLRTAFEAAAARLDEQFGRRETYDYALPRLMRHAGVEPRHAQPVLAASWSPSGSNIAHVLLEAVGSSPHLGYLRFHFESGSYPACRRELSQTAP